MAKSQMFTPQTIKRFTSVHSWVGICTGMALFIAFFAGALTMYAGPMHQWANPELRRSSGTMASIETLVASVAAEKAAKGNFSVTFEDGAGPRASYYEIGPGRSFTEHNRVLDDRGAVAARQSVSGVEHFINEIHYAIGLPKHQGYTVMGLVSAVYFLALVTGLLIHLPHLLRDLYALRVGKNFKKMWLDAHNAVGILSLPFHLMFALTGFLICTTLLMAGAMETVGPTSAPVDAYRELGGGERRGEGGGFGRGERGPPPATAAMLPPSQLLAIATGRLDGFEPTGLSYSGYGTERATATITGSFRAALAAQGSLEISPVTGRVGKVDAPGERPTAKVLEGGYLFLHYGDFGGQIMRAVYFILGMGGAFLFYSGNLLWIETRRKRRYAEQPMSGWVMAQITVGVCLGCCLGIALTLIGTRALPAELASRDDWERNLYYIGFFGAVMWSLARPPIRAGIELLFACAAAYAALPLLNALLTPDNFFVALRDGLWDVALIDGVLAALAVGFFFMARATMRRARHGQENSVWSLTSRPRGRAVPASAPAPEPVTA